MYVRCESFSWMQKYSNTIEVCSIGSDQSLLFCDLCACVQETREGCIDISVVFEGNLGIVMLVKVTTYALHTQEKCPLQYLFVGAWYAVNLTKLLQTQPQMAGHISHNKRENISIVDLVISPSDHIQASKIENMERKPKLSCQAITPLGLTESIWWMLYSKSSCSKPNKLSDFNYVRSFICFLLHDMMFSIDDKCNYVTNCNRLILLTYW